MESDREFVSVFCVFLRLRLSARCKWAGVTDYVRCARSVFVAGPPLLFVYISSNNRQVTARPTVLRVCNILEARFPSEFLDAKLVGGMRET
jgi:hypothetical protein